MQDGSLLSIFRRRRSFDWVRAKTALSSWADLEEKAKWVVDEILAKLPPNLLSEAEQIAVLFDERRKTPDGRVVLGLYCGFTPGLISERKGPIILYLRNIEQSCSERGVDFQQEVRITYLHELGHHFGWSEREVEERGL